MAITATAAAKKIAFAGISRQLGRVINSYSQGEASAFYCIFFASQSETRGRQPRAESGHPSFVYRLYTVSLSRRSRGRGRSAVRAMTPQFAKQVSQTLGEIRSQGLYKTERIITTPQDAHIAVAGGKRILNMCANNYLGLADHPALIAAAKEALETHGFGMASVRFICGTQDIHKELESALTKFLGTEDTILYPSCFDANGGLFETLLQNRTQRSTSSITPRSSMASGSARPSASVTSTATWPISRPG